MPGASVAFMLAVFEQGEKRGKQLQGPEARDRHYSCDSGEPAHANGGRSLWWTQGSPRSDQLIAASLQ